MAIGGVNIGGGGVSLPVNVHFQTIEPPEKKGLWVEGDFSKYPEVVIRSLDFQPASVAPGSSNMPNLTLWMESIETENYFVFYTAGRQPQSYSGNYIFIFDKTTGVMRSNSLFFFNEKVYPLAEGDTVYFPINGSFIRVFDAASNTFTNIPYGPGAEQTDIGLFPSVDPNYFILYSIKSGFMPTCYKMRRSDFMMTKLPNPGSTNIPFDSYFMVGQYAYVEFSRKLYKINVETYVATDLGIPFSGTMLYFTKDKKHLIYRGTGTDMALRALNLTTLVSTDLGISMSANGYRMSMSRGRNMLMSLDIAYASGSNNTNPVKFGWSEMLDEIHPDMLLINSSYPGAHMANLFPTDTGTKFPIRNAVLLTGGQPDPTKKIYVQSNKKFIPLVKKEVVDR